jgi:aspartyl-tRNA(Asn)/glutamyl-tRNA(Gln) amidotransferase subunit A
MRDEIHQLLFAPAHVVAERMATGEITSIDMVEAILSRITERNPLLNAFLTVTPEEARSEARAADCRQLSGKSRGPLDGIPIVGEGPIRDARSANDCRLEGDEAMGP